MRILLTGANGQVGKEIQHAVPRSGYECIALTRAECDIANADSVQQAIKTHKPAIVINAAAYTAVDRAEQESELAFAINATGALNLARACQKDGAALIHLSTDYVFNGDSTIPYTETDAVNPLGVYGQSKWQGEVAIRDVLPQHIILRTSWVFGAHGSNFVKTILRLAREREKLSVVADQRGCPTSAKSIALAIWQIIAKINTIGIENAPWGTYHYTDAPETNWYAFAKEIIELNKSTISVRELLPIATDQYPTLAKRPSYSVLNCKKIADAFQIEQQDWLGALQDVVIAY